MHHTPPHGAALVLVALTWSATVDGAGTDANRAKLATASDEFSKCSAYFVVAGNPYRDSDPTRYAKYDDLSFAMRSHAISTEGAASSTMDEIEIGSPEFQRINRIVLDRIKKYIRSMVTLVRGRSDGMDLLNAEFGHRCLDAHENPALFLQ